MLDYFVINSGLLVEAVLGHPGDEGGLSHHLGHPAQGLPSRAAQDGVGVVQGPHHQGQGRLTHLLRPQGALVLRQALGAGWGGGGGRGGGMEGGRGGGGGGEGNGVMF